MTEKKESTSIDAPAKTKNVLEMSFTDVPSKPQYVTDTGKLLPRKYTGLSAKEQRHFTRLTKQARNNLLAK